MIKESQDNQINEDLSNKCQQVIVDGKKPVTKKCMSRSVKIEKISFDN